MAGRNGTAGTAGDSRSPSARVRGRRRVGVSATAGAFVAGVAMATGSVIGAAPAKADVLTDILDPILQPFMTAMADALGAIDPSAGAELINLADLGGLSLSSVDPAAALSQATQFDNLLNPLFGADLFGTGAAPAAAAASTASATPINFDVPLNTVFGTEPTVDLSVNGGASVPVLVDTGSTGLVIPFQDIGLSNLAGLGFPTGLNISGYSGGVGYLYLTFDTTVSFDNAAGTAVTTTPTAVDVPILSWPTSLNAPLSFGQFLQVNGVQGILGVGVNAGGPGTTSPLMALPGDLSQGVLIDAPQHELVFGLNPLTPLYSLKGAPLTNLEVSVGNGIPQAVSGDIDSGGVYGTIPSSVVGNSGTAAGTTITVYTSSGEELYSYVTTAATAPAVVSGNTMDTGYVPFSLAPIYIDFSPSGVGTTVFDSTTPAS